MDTNAWYVLVNRNSGKALDVSGVSTAHGARVSQWTRNDGTNQQWQFMDSGGGFYQLKARHSGKVLDVAGASTSDGAAIAQWADRNGANQQFRLADLDAGHVRLINRNSGKAMEVQGASTADGGNVVQYTDWGGANQQWEMSKLSSGGGGCGSAPTLASGTHTIRSSGKSRSSGSTPVSSPRGDPIADEEDDAEGAKTHPGVADELSVGLVFLLLLVAEGFAAA